MRKPESVDTFRVLVNSMDHRERFVFSAGPAAKEASDDIDSIEVYATCLYEQATFSNGLDTNIKVSFVDVNGKQLKGARFCINKYLRLWSPKFFASVYGFIA